jgi:hypothetical protein
MGDSCDGMLGGAAVWRIGDVLELDASTLRLDAVTVAEVTADDDVDDTIIVTLDPAAVVVVEGSFASDVTVITAAAVLPAASLAVTVMTVVPGRSAIAGVLHVLVPAAVPEAPRSVAQMTCVTPTLSVAVPARTTLPSVVVRKLAVVGV